jgi:hypothetical protein
MALVSFHRDAGHREQALDYARRLQTLAPGNASLEALVRELER